MLTKIAARPRLSLLLLTTAGPSSSPARFAHAWPRLCTVAAGTPDDRVVPEHGSAGRALSSRPDQAAGLRRLSFRGFGDTEPDVVVLVRRVVVVAVRRVQVVVVVVERSAPQPAIRTDVASRSPTESLPPAAQHVRAQPVALRVGDVSAPSPHAHGQVGRDAPFAIYLPQHPAIAPIKAPHRRGSDPHPPVREHHEPRKVHALVRRQ